MDFTPYKDLKTGELTRKYAEYDRLFRINETYMKSIDRIIKELEALKDNSQITVNHTFMQKSKIMEELERRSARLEEIEIGNKTKEADD